MNTSFSENQMTQSIKLTIIIPAYNESRRIEDTLQNIREYLDRQNYLYEVIVVDDGSTDDTVIKVEKYATNWAQLRIITYLPNQGKGKAVRTGILAAKGKYVIYLDADNSTPINQLEKLWKFIDDYSIVFGSRHHPDSNIRIPQAKHRIVLSRLSNLLIRVLLLPGIYDTQCGFKLLKTDIAKDIFTRSKLKHFGFDFEVLAIARYLNHPIKEVGIDWYNDTESKVRAGREALRTLVDLLKVRIWLWQQKYQ